MSTLENDAWMEPIYYYSTYFLTALTIGMTLLVFFHSPAAKWLELKRYQYEVTMGLHMMTPTERFIVNSLIFLIFAMIVIAVSLYLPEHVSFISRRVLYYYTGQSLAEADVGTET